MIFLIFLIISACGCNTGYSVGASCNTTTGQCTCLPGVIGEKCDHCPYRHVLIPGQGCFACDSCTGDLLDVTDILSGLLNPVFEEYNVSFIFENYYFLYTYYFICSYIFVINNFSLLYSLRFKLYNFCRW